jgi:hypothetical protein
MITVIYCTRQSNLEHREHLIKSSGLVKNIEIIEIINNGESLTSCYNRGLKQAKNNIIVYCHDDLVIDTKSWGEKLLKLFERNPEFGIIGVAGTKYLAQSGKWWENPKKMYGRVAHTHEGKTWLSSYSPDLNQVIEETVIVDGVFFAVDKTKIKKEFNEEVKGFHFYDVNFCFENYLEGVKLGVTTVIRINHKSIGMTNDQWETNRQEFSEKFKDKLPISIKKKLRKGEKLNVLITSLSFDDNTPKSNIILEIASKLKKENHNITICSNINGKIANLAKTKGIILAPIQQPPGFALGDGKWKIKTQNGEFVSQPNTLYKVKEHNFDIIHIFDDEIIDHMNKLYVGCNLINTKFPNGLFINTEKNPLVKTTIEISNNIEDVKSFDVNNILNEYIEIL